MHVPVLEVGGTHVSAALVDSTAWLVINGTEARLALDSHGTADQILTTLAAAAASVSGDRAQRWGVAMPDPFDYPNGIALFEGVGKFDALNGVDIKAALLDSIVPMPEDIRFLNDADAFLLGEWVSGAATGQRRCAAVTFGTGVGSAFVADGRVVDDGPDVPRDGRVHRLEINGRPLEETLSRRALRRAYAVASGDVQADVREIADRARSGDRVATDVLGTALRKLGVALGPWFVRFGAEVVVIGGSMSASWDVLEAPFTDGVRAGGSDARLVLARDRDHAALIGAAYYVLSQRQSGSAGAPRGSASP